jgi:hypothetical protein
VVGKIKSVDLEVPNKYDTYTIDLLHDDGSQQDQVWKSGRLGNRTGSSVPVKNRKGGLHQ